MAFPAGNVITLPEASAGLVRFAAEAKLNAIELVRQIDAGEIKAERIERFRDTLRNYRTKAQPFIDMLGPRLIAYMQSIFPNDKQDLEGDFTALVAAVDAVDSYVSAVLEKNSDGKLGTQFPVSALEDLKGYAEAILATVT